MSWYSSTGLPPGELLHPDPPVLRLWHERAPRIALLELPQRPVRLAPVRRPGSAPAPGTSRPRPAASTRGASARSSPARRRRPAASRPGARATRGSSPPPPRPARRRSASRFSWSRSTAWTCSSSFSRRRARTSIASAAVAGGPSDATSSAFSASLTLLRANRACARRSATWACAAGLAHQPVGLAPVELGQRRLGIARVQEDPCPLHPLVQGQRDGRRRAAAELGVRIHGRLRPGVAHHERVEVRLGPEQVAEGRAGLRPVGEQLGASQGPQRPLQEGEGLAWLAGAQQRLSGPGDCTVRHRPRRRRRLRERLCSRPEITHVEERLPDVEAPVRGQERRRGVLAELGQRLPGLPPAQEQRPHQERELGRLGAALPGTGGELGLRHLERGGPLEPRGLQEPLRLSLGPHVAQADHEGEPPPGMEEPAGTPTRARPGTSRGGHHEVTCMLARPADPCPPVGSRDCTRASAGEVRAPRRPWFDIGMWHRLNHRGLRVRPGEARGRFPAPVISVRAQHALAPSLSTSSRRLADETVPDRSAPDHQP